MNTPMTSLPSRRDFLQKLAGGLVVLVVAPEMLRAAESEAARPARREYKVPTDFNAFLLVGEDGRVTCFTGKIEMGQGPITSLAQTLAEDLDVPVESVDMVMGDTDLCPYDQGTWGSMTTPFFGPLLRKAAAEGRQALIELAAVALSVPVAQLATDQGTVYDRQNPSRRVTYAALTKGKRIERRVSSQVDLKEVRDFKISGKPMRRTDARAKVTGEAKYTGDIRRPGMLYASIVRPPSHSATVKSVDASAARALPGVIVVEEKNLVAALHELPDLAEAAREAIKVEFTPSALTLNDRTIFEHLANQPKVPERVVGKAGEIEQGRGLAKQTLSETYYNGYVAHAPMEPHTAVAELKDGRLTVWASTQNPFGVREEVADTLRLPIENVRVITPFVGGAFGGKSANEQTVEAARLAVATKRPVQVAWTREEEFFIDHFRPATLVNLSAGLDEKGRVSFWDYTVRFSGERGARVFYTFPHHRTAAQGSFFGIPGVHPFNVGAWRGPGVHMNVFAREAHIERLAALAKVDPIEFRLRQLEEPRLVRVLKAAAEKWGWKPAAGPSGRGLGVALGEDAGTVVAMIAEVAVDRASGKVTVKRILCTQEMGQVVNPAGALAQMEGGIVMGLGYTLTEEVKFENVMLKDTNFNTYEIPRFSDVPQIDCHIVPDDTITPKGGGEPSIVLVGGAVANAIFDATGATLNQMPFTPERVKAALAKA